MCIQALIAPLMTAIGGGATAAGATAAAGAATAAGATAGAAAAGGGFLQTLGLLTSIGGTLMQAGASAKASAQMAAATASQKATEAQLTATEDDRTRVKFRQALHQQSAELIARGISLDSPTAVLLGQTAAQEASFASQEVRSRGAARQTELTVAQQGYRARAASDVLKGNFDAAGTFLTKAPDIWPELLS